MAQRVKIIGAGLAGSEAALQLADRGVEVELVEMRPHRMTPAHHTGDFAELVCSNSLKSLDGSSAAGTLKYELVCMGSRLIREAFAAAIPAGKALAVDRGVFAGRVTELLRNHPNIHLVQQEQQGVPDGPAIVATGPLTADALADEIRQLLGGDFMSFYDAAAPVVAADSIDMQRVFAQSRYGKGGDDYLNAPFDRQQYEAFMQELLNADRVILKDFERKELFSACQPVEEIARTGMDALRYGPLKPVGLADPVTGKRPWAVVQLRRENAQGTAYNLVGFQTNLKHAEQDRVFRMIPGLEQAEFLRYGVMHRNTFIDAPRALTPTFEAKAHPGLRFAGQITGTEGYCEAIASGLYVALATYADISGVEFPLPPVDSLFGSLVEYATNPETQSYQPMHVNYGLMRPFPQRIKSKQDRYRAYAKRAREQVATYRRQLAGLGLFQTAELPEVPHALSKYIVEG